MTLKNKRNILYISIAVVSLTIGLYLTISKYKRDTAIFEVGESVIIDQELYFIDTIGVYPAEGKYCLVCHEDIEPTRPHSSKMMQEIYSLGRNVGDANGCVVCHGGDPTQTTDKIKAHRGAPEGNVQSFYTPVPGSLNVNNNTCGLCHEDHTYSAHRSIMNTDAGKIKTITWGWGIGTENHNHIYGNSAIDDPDGATPRFGSDIYKGYMREMADLFPGQFPTKLKEIPQANLNTLSEMPEQAAFTYLRNCNACHLKGKGYLNRGHYRGMGCAACHNLYGNEGFYEGGDKSIPEDKTGHLMVHSMQGSRKSPVFVNGKRITGIQTSTCAACHSAGRRIGHSYQGFMPRGSSYNKGPFDRDGKPQEPNASYVFNYIKDDVHHRVSKDGEMLMGISCQDCHTTTSMHGNGNIGSTTLATVEIECADCHGTPEKHPWELPIGYGDEFGRKVGTQPRNVAKEPELVTRNFGVVYPKHDGYILTTRGNAFGNVVRDGDEVWVYTEQGLKIRVPVLKNIHKREAWKHPEKAKVAMVAVSQHMAKLECYACHSTWVPQYYGYKYVIDYRKETIDWIATGKSVQSDGTSGGYSKNHVMQPGRTVASDYSHTDWVNFPLGINGEGRVSPLTGVIQTIGTVIDQTGKNVAYNRVAKTANGINAIELQPVQPHTISLRARECSECHENPQAMGYGIDYGEYNSDPSRPRYADAVDLYGGLVSKFTKVQIQGIKGLHSNFMQILSKDGEQLLTVDSHWELSSPLTPAQREVLDRNGTCIACHQNIPEGSFPITMLHKVAAVANLSFKGGEAHAELLNQNNVLIAWVKFIGIIALLLLPFLCVVIYIYRVKIAAIFSAVKSTMKNE